jgi:hypothetical protein
MKNKLVYLTFILFFLNACQTLKDGLAGNKNKNSDEFLIEKKNPLEMPPEFGALPEPAKKVNIIDKTEKINQDIENLIKKESSTNKTQSSDQSAEDFVLKQIKKN